LNKNKRIFGNHLKKKLDFITFKYLCLKYKYEIYLPEELFVTLLKLNKNSSGLTLVKLNKSSLNGSNTLAKVFGLRRFVPLFVFNYNKKKTKKQPLPLVTVWNYNSFENLRRQEIHTCRAVRLHYLPYTYTWTDPCLPVLSTEPLTFRRIRTEHTANASKT